MPASHELLSFGPFVADLSKELLWRGGDLVPVPRKTFQVLAFLLRRRGEVLDKQEIFDAVWGTVVVEENTLVRHVAMLRRILGTTAGHDGQFIATVPGRGYRFVADVRVVASIRSDPNGRTSAPPVALTPDPQMQQPSAQNQRRWVLPSVASVIVVALAVAASSAGSFGRASTHMATGRLRQVTFEAGLQQQPTWSPDGQQIAYASDRAGNMDIWIQSADGRSRRRITASPAHDSEPAWSPDGRVIAFRSERDGGGLYLIDADGRNERRVSDFGYAPRWSPDGGTLLFLNQDLAGIRLAPNVFVLDLKAGAGTTPRQILAGDLKDWRSAFIAWIPGQRTLAVLGYRNGELTFATGPVEGPLTDWKISAALRDTLADLGLEISEFVWAPSGRFIYIEGTGVGMPNLWRVGVDPTARTITDRLERLTVSSGTERHIAISPDGTKVAFDEQVQTRRLTAFPFDERIGRIVGPGALLTSGAAGSEEDPVASTDGASVIFRARRDDRDDLWRLSLTNGEERLLLAADGWRRSNPHWSKDGSRLVYVRTTAQPHDRTAPAVVLLSSNGGAEQVVPGEGFGPSDWAPDGRAILGSCRQGQNGHGPARSAICLLPLASAPASRPDVIVADNQESLFAPRFSPDQRWISFTAVDPQNVAVSTIFVSGPSGERRIKISDRPAWDDKVRWGVDGRSLYWVSNRTGRLNVFGRLFDPVRGTPVGDAFQVTALEDARQGLPASIQGLEIAFAAHKLIVPITEATGAVWVLEGLDK